MGLVAAVTLDITKRDLDSVWDNLHVSLVREAGIEPVAIGIVFETYDIMVFLWCDAPERLNRYIINRMRSVKGVTETTVFFLDGMQPIIHEGLKGIPEPGIDGLVMMDVECGKEDHVMKALVERVKPEEEKTFTKFVSFCLHSTSLDLIAGFKGMNLYYLDQLFAKIREIDGVLDIIVLMFSRFQTLVDYDEIAAKFPWFV